MLFIKVKDESECFKDNHSSTSYILLQCNKFNLQIRWFRQPFDLHTRSRRMVREVLRVYFIKLVIIPIKLCKYNLCIISGFDTGPLHTRLTNIYFDDFVQ